MSSSDIAVSVRGLSKAYTIVHSGEKHTTAAEALIHRLKNPFQRQEKETFWALKDVEFDIKKGDVVGIIGRNGAGKSTLLKILSRITEPTKGSIALYGRVGSLLEVGTGFHPELTGRENIFLNGAILGMNKAEIMRQFDAIVDFAGVEQFLDTPVKRYSSGMYVRLAFAVAAHLASDILIVDEVLAVGDTEFQNKCIGKMQDVSKTGRTVLFVTHNLPTVTQLCSRGIVMQEGSTVFNGDGHRAISHYMDSFEVTSTITGNERRLGSGEYRFTKVAPVKQLFDSADDKEIVYQIECIKNKISGFYLSAHIINDTGLVLAQYDSRLLNFWLYPDGKVIQGSLKFTTPWLKPGTYRVDIGICSVFGMIDLYEQACTFNISPRLPYKGASAENSLSHGLVLGEFEWTTHPKNYEAQSFDKAACEDPATKK